MGNPFEDVSCIWETWEGYCNHPLMNTFCDYILDDGESNEQMECPYYKARYEPSYVEEEVRQYLECIES